MGRLFDFSRLKRTRLADRASKVSVDQWAKPADPDISAGAFIDSLPDILAASDLKAVARAIAQAHLNGRPVVMGYGAHLVKVGLSPIVADLINRGIVTGVVTNGAGSIHELEFILAGKTSEDVEARLPEGTFGMAQETADVYNAAVDEDIGLGASLAGEIVYRNPERAPYTILGACAAQKAFAGVFVAMGTDIVHMHPSCDGAALGAASHRDFREFCSIVEGMDGGVFLNVGSAVIIPEVFLKALAIAINVGARLDGLVTVNMDMIRHYRPRKNVVERPPGKGYELIGHHEIMLPLLHLAVLSEISKGGS